MSGRTNASEIELSLPRSRQAPGIARQSLTDWLMGALGQDDIERARLLVSELVANAVVHGQGQIMLRAALGQDERLVVEVVDEGNGFEHVIRERDFRGVGGNGLRIVEAEASSWGVHEGTTHVWFELEPSGPRLGTESNPLH